MNGKSNENGKWMSGWVARQFLPSLWWTPAGWMPRRRGNGTRGREDYCPWWASAQFEHRQASGQSVGGRYERRTGCELCEWWHYWFNWSGRAARPMHKIVILFKFDPGRDKKRMSGFSTSGVFSFAPYWTCWPIYLLAPHIGRVTLLLLGSGPFRCESFNNLRLQFGFILRPRQPAIIH